MIIVSAFARKTVVVLGLGKSGTTAAASLAAGGADVRVWDDGAAARAAAGYPLMPLDAFKQAPPCAALVVSPGIALDYPAPHPFVVAAKAAGIPVLGDLDLLRLARPDDRLIAITGTNGKSTTTALLGHILREAGLVSAVAGNIGVPVLGLGLPDARVRLVVEVSSYQLALNRCVVYHSAALLNITPDHLDRHGGMEGYCAAKALVFQGQSAGAAAVIGVDTPASAAVYGALDPAVQRTVIPVSVVRRLDRGVCVENGIMYDDGVRVADVSAAPRLVGVHNHQNAAVAYALARAEGVAPAVIAAALNTFPGLEHRQEYVDTLNGIEFINDSKATNAEAAEKALLSYSNIYWIVGGKSKDGGIDALIPYFPRIRAAFCVGAAAGDFAALLQKHNVPTTHSGTLEQAVPDAYHAACAQGGGVVLLSPACASFDQFANFEQRGEVFRAAVARLKAALP